MYRTTPVWYLDGISEVLLQFSSILNHDRPRNLMLLSSFPRPVLESDGIHLTPYSGYEFVLHLFDSAELLVKSLSKPPEVFVLTHNESIRALEDRVVVLEQDHRRLNHVVEYKTAVDAEEQDFVQNQRHEDHFIISGLKKAPAGLSTKEWQIQVKQDVSVIVSILLPGRDLPIEVVHNQTGVRRVTTYLVQMSNLRDASDIRKKFGSFFAGGKDSRPSALKEISIGNWVTPGTKVRIAILKVMAERYRASNPGSRVQVVGYQSRPMIRLTPPTSASDRRSRNFNFIEAIKNLPTNFTPDQIKSVMAKVNPRLYSNLRALFIILDDDMPKVHRSNPIRRPPTTSDDTEELSEAPEATEASVPSISPVPVDSVGPGSGTEPARSGQSGSKRTLPSAESHSSKNSRR